MCILVHDARTWRSHLNNATNAERRKMKKAIFPAFLVCFLIVIGCDDKQQPVTSGQQTNTVAADSGG